MSAEAIGHANASIPVIQSDQVGGQTPKREVARTRKTEIAQDAPASPGASAPEASEDDVRRSAELVSEAVSRLNHGVRFEIDDSTHTIVTKVIDKNTNEVIRQIPSEEILEIARRLRQDRGVLLNLEA